MMNENQIIGKYTGVNVTIPEGSMFYEKVLVNREELPGTWLQDLHEDANGVVDIPYYMAVNIVTTFANSIQPHTYIDIYMKARDESNLVMFGKLIENIEVLAVKDSGGQDVFTSVESNGAPAFLFFGLPEELHILMRQAAYLSSIGIELIIVPHGGKTPITGDVEVSSQYLRDYIDAHRVAIPTNEEYLEELGGVPGGNGSNSNTDTNTVSGSDSNSSN